MDDLYLARNLKKTLSAHPEDQVRRVVQFVFAGLEDDWRKATLARLSQPERPEPEIPMTPIERMAAAKG